ncbi:MAG: UDP-N-acetylmuramoyl-L-alanine--D-glutamate ligase [Cyanobacteria bacterium P01_H01_bin.74]
MPQPAAKPEKTEAPLHPGTPLTVLGMSRSGYAAAMYAVKRGQSVFLSEYSPLSPANEDKIATLKALGVALEVGGHGKACFSHAETVVLSPGIPPSASIIEQLTLSKKSLMAEVNYGWLALQALNQKRSNQNSSGIKTIGITGTNGKSTVTTLLSAMFACDQKTAPACGNIGIPLTSVLDKIIPIKAKSETNNNTKVNTKPEDQQNTQLQADTPVPEALVIELSSYQLAFSPDLHCDIAILTNFQPDHLAWHGSVENYKAAKLSLFSKKNAGVSIEPQWAILPADDPVSHEIAAILNTQETSIFWFSPEAASVAGYENKAFINASGYVVVQTANQPVIEVLNSADCQLIGRHNQSNILAATCAAILSGISIAAIKKACLAFKGLPHRLNLVTSVQKQMSGNQNQTKGQNESPIAVKFYNDSKATNTDAAICAMKAFDTEKIILIAGGHDKLTPLDDFVKQCIENTQAVILLGQAADRFQKALIAGGYHQAGIYSVKTLADAVHQGFSLSEGSPVVLSPACASFGEFNDFEARGNAFEKIVKELAVQP